ncbi:MAG: tyrosine-type recombinase/integrase, partial [Candidatus Woesearchaeota archaeon]
DYTDETINKYLREVENICKLKGYSRRTISAHSYNIKRFLFFVKKCSLNLDHEAVKYYLLSLELSINPMRLQYASLRFFFSLILKRPFTTEDVPIKKKEKQLPEVLSKEQIMKMIDNTNNPKHKLIIKFLYSSGLRLQELINLKRRDIDFDIYRQAINQCKSLIKESKFN